MYIFGYGSLINDESRRLTGETGKAFPALVSGLQRHWSKVSTAKMSPLVVREGSGYCNGVLIHIDDSALDVFDIREAGYKRILLDSERVKVLDDAFVIDGPVYVYVTEEVITPCTVQPVVQSYVDTVMAGCLRYSADFAQTFVTTTHGWQYPRLNDRSRPLYQRVAGVRSEDRPVIDALLVGWEPTAGV
ncbi:gamma-glutamylcyclotransferase family protein [Enterovibrio calviensis]|uniref:gamma-glutamylcyclotransferase family protein n=1 Tax=Enterovibrio calviensis TaxID=91359 RepID=UPI0037358B16